MKIESALLTLSITLIFYILACFSQNASNSSTSSDNSNSTASIVSNASAVLANGTSVPSSDPTTATPSVAPSPVPPVRSNRTAVILTGQLRSANLSWYSNKLMYDKHLSWYGKQDPETTAGTIIEWLFKPLARRGLTILLCIRINLIEIILTSRRIRCVHVRFGASR